MDDEPSIRMLARTVLRRRGYTILDAGGGDEALAVAGRHKGALDLLLTDVNMPGMSGPNLYARLLERIPGLTVLYMSSNVDPDLMPASTEGANASFLQKPFTLDGLVQKVRETLKVTRG